MNRLDNSLFCIYDEDWLLEVIFIRLTFVHFWFRLSFRTRLGIISTVFLTFAVVLLLLWYCYPLHFTYRQSWVIRFAPLFFLLWIAWSDLTKIPWWYWLIILATLIMCAVKPAFWLVGIPVVVYILFAGHKK